MVTVWWRHQYGAATPVGLDIRAWISPDRRAPVRVSYNDALPRADADVEFGALGSQLLRDIPVGRIVDETRKVLNRLSEIAHPAETTAATDSPGLREFRTDLKDLVPHPDSLRPKRGGRDLGDAHYAEVARVYADAVRAGKAPTEAVKDRYVISKSAAAKQVARARERGFLPPTSRGRIGKPKGEL
jgi:hypothetical protein